MTNDQRLTPLSRCPLSLQRQYVRLRQPLQQWLRPFERQLSDTLPQPFLPQIGILHQIVLLEPVRDHLVTVLYVQDDVDRKVDVGRTDPRGIERERSDLERELQRILVLQRAI